MRMIRTPEWKLVRHFEPEGTDELYHLSEDPGEAHNLANFTAANYARRSSWLSPES